MMHLSIARTMLAIFIATVAISVLAVGTFGRWIEEKTVSSLAAEQSRRDAELVFQNLYSVMRKGWTKAEISELIERINTTQPDIQVAVHRSQQVADAFGEIETDASARRDDPLIREALQSGNERLSSDGDTLRFVYPVRVTEECGGCHLGVALGSVNGVIDIRFPMDRLKAPLGFSMRALNWSFAAVIGLLFVLVMLKVRFLLVRPITDLAHHIDGIVVSGDLGRRVKGRQFTWLLEVNSLAHNFNRLMNQLEASRSELLRQSITDPLTGLVNRRQFDTVFAREVARFNRHGHSLAVIMIDLDGFKPINDRLGHAAGDAVLREVGRVLRENVRINDTPARIGGDEFAVLATETSGDGATILAQKLEEAINGLQVEVDGGMASVGASVGVAVIPDDSTDMGDALARADQAMYACKQAHKSQDILRLRAS